MKVATNMMTKKALTLKTSNLKRKIVRPADPLVLTIFSPLILFQPSVVQMQTASLTPVDTSANGHPHHLSRQADTRNAGE
jgi:hypothetical protein